MASLDDLLRFILSPPPGDPSLTAQQDQISISVVTAAGASAGQVPVANGGGTYTWGAGGGGGGSMPAVVFPETYGAIGDNSHDDTTAIQSAVNAVKVAGGTVYFDATKTYKITAPIYLGNNSKAFRLTSAGGDGALNDGCATIHLSGAGGGTGHSGGAIQFNDPGGQSAYGVELDHLRFTYDPNSFKGPNTFLINVSPYNNGAGDIEPFDIHHCAFSATASVNPSNGCQSMMRLHQAIVGQIRKCQFGSAQEGIRLGDLGGSYVNVVTIEQCTFNYMQSAHILIGTSDGESITIRENTFEDAPANGAIYGGNYQNLLYGPSIINNWFGDYSSTFTPGYWINGLNTNGGDCAPGLIASNRFAEIGAGGFHLTLEGTWIVQANGFSDGTVYNTGPGLATPAIVSTLNNYDTNGAIFGGSTIYWGGQTWSMNDRSPLTGVAGPHDRINNFDGLHIGTNGQPGSLSSSDLSSAVSQIVLGTNSSVIANANRALIYTDMSGGAGPSVLRLQAPATGSNNEVQLIAGTASPAPLLRASGNGLAFYNTAPITQPSAVGTATGYTAGTTAATFHSDDKYTGNVGTTAYTLNGIVAALKNLGLIAS